jgi:hypothetical protein
MSDTGGNEQRNIPRDIESVTIFETAALGKGDPWSLIDNRQLRAFHT